MGNNVFTKPSLSQGHLSMSDAVFPKPSLSNGHLFMGDIENRILLK